MPEREYERYIANLDACADWGQDLRQYRARFITRYPDLSEWFERPLRERIGWRKGESQSRRLAPTGEFDYTAGYINHNARPYLIYLGLTGRARLDWGWLLGIGILKPWAIADGLGLPLSGQVDELLDRQMALGHCDAHTRQRVHWAIPRLLLHKGTSDIEQITIDDIEEMRQAIRDICEIPEFDTVMPPKTMQTGPKVWNSYTFQTGVALYHAGIIHEIPQRNRYKPLRPVSNIPVIKPVFERYLIERALIDRPGSVEETRQALRRFSSWVEENRPKLKSLNELNRDDLVEFMTWLKSQKKIRPPYDPVSNAFQRLIIHQVAMFFRRAAEAEWDEVPARAPLSPRDIPRLITRIPRAIPAGDLEPLLEAIRDLECPLQRCALLVARWSGARRGEIRKLHMDCLSAYPDGTARLRLAAGKSAKERMVPLHEEAADAIRAVLEIRATQPDRPIYDIELGQPVRYLFLRHGRLACNDYLFRRALDTACTAAGLMEPDGSGRVNAHRFRHTLGTELGEKGARLQTIMKVLGHQSPGMSMTYVNMTDPTILADYASVLTPGALIAGPQAEAIRGGQLGEEAVNWLKTNFLKTELELGRCLRLPQEGPCECDLYLTCSKFVTTPAYADRLRRRVTVEDELITDAQDRGLVREVERHQRIRARVIDLLTELNEPVVPNKQRKYPPSRSASRRGSPN
ncbi:tyrosine-type recombinase/integrase [Mycobacteroides abscessus]